jgi:hypothetical protein
MKFRALVNMVMNLRVRKMLGSSQVALILLSNIELGRFVSNSVVHEVSCYFYSRTFLLEGEGHSFTVTADYRAVIC